MSRSQAFLKNMEADSAWQSKRISPCVLPYLMERVYDSGPEDIVDNFATR